MHFDKKEYTKLLNYILSNSYDKPHVGKTVITTTLYFIDFNYYEAYGKSLTKETYQKHKKGINPMHFTKITEELIEKNKIYFVFVPDSVEFFCFFVIFHRNASAKGVRQLSALCFW